ncbi:MAG: discoidin domain-containing protein [Actinomycetota bacterium]
MRRNTQERQQRVGQSLGRRSVAVVAALATMIAGVVAFGGSANAQAVAAREGQWGSTTSWDMIPIHATLDAGGRVVTWGNSDAVVGGVRNQFVTWDPGSGSRSYTRNTVGSHQFCAATVTDTIGRRTLMLGGKTTALRDNSFAAQFQSGAISNFDQLTSQRCLGNAVTLADGRIVMVGGAPVEDSKISGSAAARTAEIWEDGVGWTNLSGTFSNGIWSNDKDRWFYPRAHVMPDGRVWSLAYDETYIINPTGNGSLSRTGGFPGGAVGASSMSVQYGDGLVLQVGGGASDNRDRSRRGSTEAWIVDLNGDSPTYTRTGSMTYGRHWGDAVVLPNGNVIVVGGSGANNQLDDVAYAAEMWNPRTGSWSTLASNSTPRLYHSVALLMNNGEIFVGGGGASGPVNNKDAETFAPPYLFNADGTRASQMTISGAPDSIEHGTSFSFNASGSVSRVTMIKVNNATHSVNTQVFQELEFTQFGNEITAGAPENPNIATPGLYQLFALDASGVPSAAAMVWVEPGELLLEPTGENLALGRPATASSTSGDTSPASAVDGDKIGTSWASNPVDNQTFEVDLGTMASIEAFVIRWAEDYGTRYAIDVSDDQGSWTEVYRSDAGAGDRDILFLDAAVDGRHVRLRAIESGTGNGFEMYEFEVYGVRTPIDFGENLALNKPATASSRPDGPAALAVDGQRDTTWVSDAADGENFQVDLGTLARIDTVNIEWGRRGFGERYVVEVSRNGTTWLELHNETAGNGAGDILDVTDAALTGRYVRVRLLERGTADAFSLEEFEVYGARTGERGENLALNKPAQASSIQDDNAAAFGPTRANDGDDTTQWGSAFDDGEWLQIDLGRRARIDEIVLEWDTAFAKFYTIEVSDDGESWSEVYRTTDGLGDLDEFRINATGRHLRLEARERGTTDNFALLEFEAYGEWLAQDDRGLNLALLKPAQATSIQDDNPAYNPGRAVDGNISTRWSSAFADNQEFMVNLGAPARIDEIVIEWDVAFGRTYAVDVSDDGVNWLPVYSTTGQSGGNDEFRVDTTGQYVRLRAIERGTDWGFSIWEFEVYGAWLDQDNPPPDCTNGGAPGDDGDTDWWCEDGGGIDPGPWDVDIDSPDDLRDEITARLDVPSLDVATSPGFDSVTVGLETWFWVLRGWETTEGSSTTPEGVLVEVRVIPVRATWDFGDGATLVCNGPGTAWSVGATTDCSHTYTSSSAGLPDDVYKGSLTITREHHSWEDGVYQGIDRTSDLIRHFELPVGEIQVIETGD